MGSVWLFFVSVPELGSGYVACMDTPFRQVFDFPAN